MDFVDRLQCHPCPPGHRPTANRSHCDPIDEDHISYRNPWAAVAMAFASLGNNLIFNTIDRIFKN